MTELPAASTIPIFNMLVILLKFP